MEDKEVLELYDWCFLQFKLGYWTWEELEDHLYNIGFYDYDEN